MPMPIIEGRRIEAEIVGHIDRELVERIGREALEIDVEAAAEIGALMSCNRDAAFSAGYHPAMTLDRTETLMEGGRRCDFRYRLDTPGGQ